MKTKGTSIDERPIHINDRLEFGHWEGDTVIETKKDDEVLFTLVERKTRQTIIIKLKNRKSKNIYMARNKLDKKLVKKYLK